MKMQMTGQLIVCVDLETTIGYYRQGWRVICLSEDKQHQAVMPDLMMGSVLLPPYESMDALLDGNKDLFALMYSDYLFNNLDVRTMQSIILAALYRGVNIVIFIPPQEYEMGFINVFLQCYTSATGVYVGFHGQSPAVLDYNYNNSNMIRLYMEGLFPYSELLLYYEGPINDPTVCIRVCADIGFITEKELEAIQYVNSFKSRVEESGKFLPKGLIRA